MWVRLCSLDNVFRPPLQAIATGQHRVVDAEKLDAVIAEMRRAFNEPQVVIDADKWADRLTELRDGK